MNIKTAIIDVLDSELDVLNNFSSKSILFYDSIIYLDEKRITIDELVNQVVETATLELVELEDISTPDILEAITVLDK